MLRTFSIAGCLFAIAALANSCRTRYGEESGLLHLEGDVVHNAPAFMWHELPASALQRFVNNQSDSRTSVIAQESPVTKRLQRILDHHDSVARKLNPDRMAKIPRPVAAVLKADKIKAFVKSRSVCIKQWIKKDSAPVVDLTTLPTPPALGAAVVDFSYPGDIYETTLSATPPPTGPDAKDNSSYCEVVEPSSVGWDVNQFVEMYNVKLPSDKQQCRLSVSGEVIVTPADEKCGRMTRDYVGVTRFEAQANVVFFYTGLLSKMSESSVAAAAAHELAHIYRAHSPALTSFSPYFFAQTAENELRRPEETKDYKEVREAMLDASYLDAAPRTVGAKFDANVFEVTMDLRSDFLGTYCKDGRPCVARLAALRDHIGMGGKFDRVWESIGLQPLIGETRDLYLRYEELLVETLESIDLTSLSDADKKKISDAVPAHMTRFFGDLGQQASIVKWLEKADKALVEEIPKLRIPFEKGATLGLGFYSPEEEADEVGLEVAARSGVSGDQASGLWIQFMSAKRTEGFQPGIRETSYDECDEMRRNGWKSGAKQANPVLLIDSLANIHHGMSYRLFNTEREWRAHQMNKLSPNRGALIFDEDAWKKAVLDSMSLSTLITSHSTNSPESMEGVSSRKRNKNPPCIFMPRETFNK